MSFSSLGALGDAIVACRRCPRLVAYTRRVARDRKRQYAAFEYWGRPVPGTGDARARILLVGLAPAAHGANRTGRMFTGDGSGEFLTAALHRAGIASQPTSVSRGDGLRLLGAFLSSAIRCAPPDNRPLPEEIERCRRYLLAELSLLGGVKVIVALGGVAHAAVLRAASETGWAVPRPLPRFGHAALATLERFDGERVALVASYHPSRQNTNTGRLTPAMLDDVLGVATAAAGVRKAESRRER